MGILSFLFGCKNENSYKDKHGNEIIDEYISDSTFTETTYTDGIDLKFTTKWIRINKSPNSKLNQVLEENGIN